MTGQRLVSEQVREKVLQYAPVLYFGRGENFYPMDAADYVAQCSLHLCVGDDEHQLILPPGYARIEHLAEVTSEHFLVYADETFIDPEEAARLAEFVDQKREETYLTWKIDLLEDIRRLYEHIISEGLTVLRPAISMVTQGKLGEQVFEKALDLYTSVKDNPPTYYYLYVPKVRCNRNMDVLQYWFFYAYNDWATSYEGINDHEGDWEAIFLYFNDITQDEFPVEVLYSFHNTAKRRPWFSLKRIEKFSPAAYVALGSHANLPDMEFHPPELRWLPGGRVIGRGGDLDWQDPVDLNDMAWAKNFGGYWGARYLWINLPGHFDVEKLGCSPHGPLYNSAPESCPGRMAGCKYR